jgi:hypothetical protein
MTRRKFKPRASAPFFDRRAGDGEANAVRVRQDWQDLADKTRSACSLSGGVEDGDTLLELQRLVARTGRAAPPFEAAPVRSIAAAFRLMCEALTASHPERRAAMADAMVAGARLVDGFLTDERNRLADGWRRQSGGDS